MISPLLESLLDPNHVLLNLRGTTAAEAIWEIVESLGGRGRLRQPKEFFEAVMKREMSSSTVANGGVAFPHARTNLVSELLLGIGRSNHGVTFSSEPEKAVHLLFVIAVPQQMVNDYLICVGSLARRLSDEPTREALLKAETTAEFFAYLRGE